MLAVISTRTYRVEVASKEIVADCSLPASKAYAREAVRSVKERPSVEPWIFRVCERLGQPPGSRSTTRSTRTEEPRSTWAHCGRSLLRDSQYVARLPSPAFGAG